MSSPINAILTGSFTTPAALVPVFIPLTPGYTTIKIVNESDVITPAATIIEASGDSAYPAGSARVSTGNGANPNVLTDTMLITAGFTFISDSGALPLGALATNITASTNAALSVVSTATPPAAGQVVRLYSTTTALQLAGMDYTVGTVVAGVSFVLANLATAPGSAATAGSFRVVNADARFYPRVRTITGISVAANAVIALSVNHTFVAGEKVRIYVPTNWGMTQLDGTVATIVAVGAALGGTTNTITVDVSTLGMTAFAFPTSAQAALGVNFPQVVPVGEAATVPYANLLDDATHNVSFTGVVIDPAILVASKTYSWIATKGLTV